MLLSIDVVLACLRSDLILPSVGGLGSLPDWTDTGPSLLKNRTQRESDGMCMLHVLFSNTQEGCPTGLPVSVPC